MRNRGVEYLRVSITDRLGINSGNKAEQKPSPSNPNSQGLSLSDAFRIVFIHNGLGVCYYRFTDAESISSQDLAQFILDVKSLPGTRLPTLTTSGVTLVRMAGGLKTAGLDTVNIILNSIQGDRY